MHPGLYASCDILFFFLWLFFNILRSILTLPMEKNVPSLTLWHISCGLSGNLWDISTCTQWDETNFEWAFYFHKPVFLPDYCFNYRFFASFCFRNAKFSGIKLVGNPEPHSTWKQYFGIWSFLMHKKCWLVIFACVMHLCY